MAIGNEHGRRFSERDIGFLILAVGLVVGAAVYFGGSETISPAVLQGGVAPEIGFVWEDGKAGSLSSLRGSAVLVNFWAAWCAPCLEEMPSLVALERSLEPKGLKVLAINVEEPGEALPRPVIPVPRHLIYQFGRVALSRYRVNGIPLTLLIDKAGLIRKIYRGPVDWQRAEVVREVEALLR